MIQTWGRIIKNKNLRAWNGADIDTWKVETFESKL
jgi:hypothetical protein